MNEDMSSIVRDFNSSFKFLFSSTDIPPKRVDLLSSMSQKLHEIAVVTSKRATKGQIRSTNKERTEKRCS
jgi:hypothetical protein